MVLSSSQTAHDLDKNTDYGIYIYMYIDQNLITALKNAHSTFKWFVLPFSFNDILTDMILQYKVL